MYNLKNIDFVVVDDVVYLCTNYRSILHNGKPLTVNEDYLNLNQQVDFREYINDNSNCYYSIGLQYAVLIFILKKYTKSEIGKNVLEIRRTDIKNGIGWNYANVFKYIKNKEATKEELFALWKDLQKSFLDEKVRHQIALKRKIGFSRGALRTIKVAEVNAELAKLDLSKIKQEYPNTELKLNK